jgi:hypothetical protein
MIIEPVEVDVEGMRNKSELVTKMQGMLNMLTQKRR